MTVRRYFAVCCRRRGRKVAFQFLLSPLSLMWAPVTLCRTTLFADWKRLPKYIYYFRVSEYNKVLRSTALTNSWSMSLSWGPDYLSDLAGVFTRGSQSQHTPFPAALFAWTQQRHVCNNANSQMPTLTCAYDCH